MNFIRSVLEHHRQGGNADELENEYHRLVNNTTQETNAEHHSQSQTGRAEQMHANPRSSIRDGLGSQHNIVAGAASAAARGVATASANNVASSNQSVALTAEQRAMIEAKRAEALRRRQERMRQQAAQQAPFNPYAK